MQGEPSGFPFLDSLVGSYLSIDTDGRVVRLDTLSKIIAPGCRLGWLTAQPSIVERILRITETSTQQPSGFVQSMVAKLIMGDQITKVSGGKPRGPDAPGWRMDGWVRWLEGLRGGYEKRMHTMCTILDQGRFFNDPVTSPTYMADWEIIQNYPIFRFEWPRGGMFVWVQLCLEMHPLAFHLPFAELAAALWRHLIKEPYRLIVAPGWLFASTEEIKENAWRYMRLCFAAMDEDDVATSSNKFIEGCRSFWRIEDLRDLPPVDEEGEAVDLHNAFGQAL